MTICTRPWVSASTAANLIHEVPYLPLGDGTKNYKPFEAKLGEKASHGCVRIQRLRNDDGYNMTWLWDNMKKGTKILVWDDDGRQLPYPEDSLLLYYNPEGGKNYHALAECPGVRDKYLPLAGFTYGELETGDFAQLTPCASCAPVKRSSEIDALNVGLAAGKTEKE